MLGRGRVLSEGGSGVRHKELRNLRVGGFTKYREGKKISAIIHRDESERKNGLSLQVNKIKD